MKALPEEVEAICKVLQDKTKKIARGCCQVDGYSADVQPAPGFEDRFEDTLAAVKKQMSSRKINGYFSEPQTYIQPFSCWRFFIERVYYCEEHTGVEIIEVEPKTAWVAHVCSSCGKRAIWGIPD